MKIAFVLATPVLSPSNGVKMQAYSWKKGLENLGHDVTLIEPWGTYNWKGFDIIHFFSFNDYLFQFVTHLKPINPNIVVSPILDPDHALCSYRIMTRWGSRCLKLHNRIYDFRRISKLFKAVSVRSDFEGRYLVHGIGIDERLIVKNPLAYRFDIPQGPIIKDDFCLHVSLLADKRKNVARLIEAAKKFGFNLVLGGKLRSTIEEEWLNKQIDGVPNITYVGYLSDETLVDLYRRAKVFALPSTNEGVGLVALDAAIHNCNIVITSLGGPKEYYNGLAWEVNPYSMNEIGTAIIQAMNDSERGNLVGHYIAANYSLNATMTKLAEDYKNIHK